MESWQLHDRGRDLVVETSQEGDRTRARLLVDGEQRTEDDGSALDTIKLRDGDLRVKVGLLGKGRARSVELIDHGDDGPPPEGDDFRVRRFAGDRVPFEPPPGTRAARRYAWQQSHPRLWAARHVAIEGGAIVLGVLGVGAVVSALFGRLLPRLDLDWLPDIDPPDWLHYVDPLSWLGRILPDWDLPDWNLPELGWLRYAVILAIAAGVGVHEYRKRRQRNEREGRGPPEK